jgi:hypothetical protein
MMPKCNLDQRGRVLRFFGGLMMFFGGSILFVVGVPGDTYWWRVFQIGLMVLGVFITYEGIMGWCALRAMGFKTKF